MQPQGFHSFDVSETGIAPPSGYGAARATLGDFSETVFFDTSAWTFRDYERHWKWSARALLSGESSVIFCTDYAPENCACLMVWKQASGFVVQQSLIPSSEIARDGERLSWLRPEARPFERASTWHATAPQLAGIANG